MGSRLVFVSTRRAQPAVDSLAGKVVAKYILHDMLSSVKAPMHELSSAQLVVLEVPPVCTQGFEHDLLNFVRKVLDVNVPVVIIVQPSLRRKSNKSIWVHKWNYLPRVPFKFRQTCSCRLGNGIQRCHLT